MSAVSFSSTSDPPEAFRAALERVREQRHTPADIETLRRALASGQIAQATGEKAIAIGGNVDDAVIVSGDNNIIAVFKDFDADAIRQIFHQVLVEIESDRYARTLKEYFAALRKYCRNLPYLTLYDIRPPKKLDEVYVPLQLRKRRPKHEPGSKGDETQRFPASTPDTLSIAEVLQQVRKPHLLILGEPGAGKSTLLRRLAEQAWDDPQAIGLERPYLPMLISLRTLASKSGALDRRLAAAVGDELPLGEDLPEGFFRAWAQQMDAPWLLLLDGLDEVPEDHRPSLMQWLDGILPLLSEGRVIITARPSVYDSREWEPKPFSVYDIQPFTPEQTKALAEKWFGDEAPAFLNALEKVRAAALSGTPLLLTIAAKVYLRRKEETGVGSLPERRSQLYDEFINTLLKEAEARGLRAELGDDVADVAKPALARLALAMTEHPAWVDEETLAQVAAEYLEQELGLKRELAEARGRRFVQVMGRRSGIFLQHGGTYEWLHPTFREYLTAWWVVKKCRGRFRRVWDRLIVYYGKENYLYSVLWAIDILGVEKIAHEVTSKLIQHVSRRKGLEYSLAQIEITPLLCGLSEWKFYDILFSIGLNRDFDAETRFRSGLFLLTKGETDYAEKVLENLAYDNKAYTDVRVKASRLLIEVQKKIDDKLASLLLEIVNDVTIPEIFISCKVEAAELLQENGLVEEATQAWLTLVRFYSEPDPWVQKPWVKKHAINQLFHLEKWDDLSRLAQDDQIEIYHRIEAARLLGLRFPDKSLPILQRVIKENPSSFYVRGAELVLNELRQRMAQSGSERGEK